MPYIKFDTFPDSIGVGRTAYGISYRRDQTNWVAQVEEVLTHETELTKEEYEAQVEANTQWELDNPEPQPEAQVVQAKPTLDDILAVLPKDALDALAQRMQSQEAGGVLGV